MQMSGTRTDESGWPNVKYVGVGGEVNIVEFGEFGDENTVVITAFGGAFLEADGVLLIISVVVFYC